MNFGSIIKLSLVGLKANKTRSVLTMLGIIIGISAVIIIMSVGAGAQSLILSQVEKVGSNLIGILSGASAEDGPPAAAFGITVTTLRYEDAVALARQVPEVAAAAAFVRGIETVSWQNQQLDTTFVGTMASYLDVEDTEVAMGHFFSESDEKGIARVAVLGSALALDLFGGQDPLGQKIKIRRESFEVIGVMKARGTVAFENVDDQMFIPLFSAQKLLLGINHVNFIRTKIGSQADMDLAILEVTELLRQRHNISNPVEDDFSVRNQAEALDMLTTITNALKFFLAAIAAISLLVGGIGIMNIMYIAVSERTREIGLRKAVGANRSYLLKQFLTEAIIITMTGGVIGIIFGALISLAVALGANYLGYNWELIITLPSVLVGFILSTAIGLIFGYFPAQKAAALDPIIALRYE
ncbi:MAG: hypothetical protein A2260_02965 [Candidatus Komeilibacteria bacterium RIFOXYA2_FULL_45_9]|nr:MAG: hypothetical protein A2260_02965 [Candidatus Komeilibacteria bacterium RIFOXYA2_FULL_45_9]